MKDPCWKNYKMIGTKKKNGRTVPNCVKDEASFVSPRRELKSNLPLTEEQKERAEREWREHLKRQRG